MIKRIIANIFTFIKMIIVNPFNELIINLAKLFQSTETLKYLGILLVGLSIVIMFTGYYVQFGNIGLGGILTNLWSNLSTEILSIAFTVLIIDRLNQLRDERREKERLIREMGSSDNSIALRAVKELRALGWLTDGSLMGADLSRANLREANLVGADLRAELIEANLENANLGGANLAGADLRGANMRRCLLVGTNLNGTLLYGANMSESNLSLASLENAKLGYFEYMDESWRSANLEDAKLDRASLKGAIAVAVNFNRVKFSGLGQPAEANSMRYAIWNFDSKYDGRFRLKGDIAAAKIQGLDINCSEEMAEFYGVTLDEYNNGQTWAGKCLIMELEQQKRIDIENR